MTALAGIESVSVRRALEALRNGVPNGDAVRVLGCAQPHVLSRFENQLSELATATGDELPVVPGMLVSGDFGAGKSHLLEYLEGQALSSGFVVSRVVISKETPLYDPAKVFHSAMAEARIPGPPGSVIHELSQMLDYRSAAGMEFEQWAMTQPGLLAATVHLHNRSNDMELQARILDFWAGEKLGVADVRAGLRQVGTADAYDVKAIKQRELALLRFEFAARLARGAGFKGWVLLIDEVELVGRYSLQQRAKSYAELARWLGELDNLGIPGITSVATITDDFDIMVLREKGDVDLIGERLRAKGGDDNVVLASRAEIGMRIIERDKMPLILPTDETLSTTFDRLRDVYSTAYGSAVELPLQMAAGRQPMRTFIRSWITEWDLRRLFPGEEFDLTIEAITTEYAEDNALEAEPEVDDDAP